MYLKMQFKSAIEIQLGWQVVHVQLLVLQRFPESSQKLAAHWLQMKCFSSPRLKGQNGLFCMIVCCRSSVRLSVRLSVFL